MTPALRTGYAACYLLLAAFYGILTASDMWPSWSALTGHKEHPIPVAVTASLGPRVLPRDETIPAPTQAVLIPSHPAPAGAVSFASSRNRPRPAIISAAAGPALGGGTPVAAISASADPALGGDVPMAIDPPRMPEAPIPATLRMPSGAGPFPVIVLLHGCNGPFTGMPAWAYRLNAWGYAALMPDSLTPRGVKTICDPAEQPKVTPSDRVGDVGAAIAWLRTRPEIDPDRIAVLGLSHGGATAMLATQTPYAALGLRAAVDYHGPCIAPRLHGSVPLLVLAGEADDWGHPAERCRAYGQDLRPDQPFELHTYPGVYHSFDGGSTTQAVHAGHIVQHNQAAAEDSFAHVRAFLDRWMRP